MRKAKDGVFVPKKEKAEDYVRMYCKSSAILHTPQRPNKRKWI